MGSVDNNSNSHFLVIQEIDYKSDYVENSHAADFETAIHHSEYGKFHVIVLAVSGLIYATCAISTTTLSFVLPAAECDFSLSSSDKGQLSAMPLIGMIFGCGVWGSIADAKGRRPAIVLSLLVDFVAALVSSFASTYNLFLMCRFFNGFGIIGATSIVFSYLGEFCPRQYRDIMLGRLEVFWNVGVIVLPGLAWLFLGSGTAGPPIWPDTTPFSSWRIFVLLCGLPSLCSLTLLCFLPETPKFLISVGRYQCAKKVFQKVFTCNTGRPTIEYPVLFLEGENDDNSVILKIDKETPIAIRLCQKASTVRRRLLSILSQPYLKYILIASFADFALMASYYTLIMWFPEIFERFSQFESLHPDVNESVCIVSKNHKNKENFIWEPCNSTINSNVFIRIMIVGLSCIPSSVSLSFFMNKFGKKLVLITGLVSAGLSTLALNWVMGSTQTLVLSCIFESLTSVLEAVIFCIIVDLFPTNLRAFALAITATSGRLGAIIGNLLFGLLVDFSCLVPIYIFGVFLIASGILSIIIPNTDSYFVLH